MCDPIAMIYLFWIYGRKVSSSQIEQFLVFSSPSSILQDMLLSTGTRIGDEKHDVMVKCLRKGELNSVEVTSELLHPKQKVIRFKI